MGLGPVFQHPGVYIPQIKEVLHGKAPRDHQCDGLEPGINPDTPCLLYDSSVRPDTNGYPRLYLKGDTKNGLPNLQLKLHHAIMLVDRYDHLGKDDFAWEFDEKKPGALVVAHLCHQKYCKIAAHMALVPKGVNTNQSQQNCFDYLLCVDCGVRMHYPCLHEQVCGRRCIAVHKCSCTNCNN